MRFSFSDDQRAFADGLAELLFGPYVLAFELTKMGVTATARGLKAGEALLAAMIERAKAMRAQQLYLLTNRKCAAAIHLYEKAGFVHDAGIMAQYGARYARCDVAMDYPL